MLIPGWYGNPKALDEAPWPDATFHDASAVLLRDGVVIAAIEEERLNRLKHTKSFPAGAIRFCLKQAHATLLDVDTIVADFTEGNLDYLLEPDSWIWPHRGTGRSLSARSTDARVIRCL